MTTDRMPEHTVLPTAAIFDETIPAALLRSYARLVAAAWRNEYRQTDPLDFQGELVPLLGVSRSRARDHLRLLRFARLVDWTTDGANRYVLFFGERNSGEGRKFGGARSEDSDGVVGESNSLPPDSGQQQQTNTPNARAEIAPQSGDGPEAAAQQEVFQYLMRAGVWSDRAARIASLIVENEGRGAYYLPGPGDVLGWIAYCFAFQRENKIEQPAAVLAANLLANRRCPEKHLPRRICANCRFEEGHCRCTGEPAYHYPEEYIDYAFEAEYEPSSESYWGVCHTCHGMPCQCVEGA